MSNRHQPLNGEDPIGFSSAYCWWLNLDSGQVEIVHLWGSIQNGTDSIRGEVYPVRHCLVCGAVDLDSIMASWQKKEGESGREVPVEAEAAPPTG